MLYYGDEYTENIALALLQDGMTEEEIYIHLEGEGFNISYEQDE